MCAHGGRSSLFYGKQRDRSGVDPFAVCVGPTRRRCRRAGACRGPPLGQRAARRCSSQRRACAGSGPHADSGPLREEPRENKRESVSPPWWIQRPMRGPHADSGPCGQRMGRCIHHGGLTDSLLFSLGSSLRCGLSERRLHDPRTRRTVSGDLFMACVPHCVCPHHVSLSLLVAECAPTWVILLH